MSRLQNGAGHGGPLGRDGVGGCISPTIPRLPLAKASRRLAGLTRKPEPGGTLCEGVWCPREPNDPVGRLMPPLNDWCRFCSSILHESGPTSHARPVHAIFERSGSGAAPHVVEHMLSESNLAGPDIQLRIADYAGRAHTEVYDGTGCRKEKLDRSQHSCMSSSRADQWLTLSGRFR